MKIIHKSKKVSKGEYLYRGFTVTNCGYFEPEQRICWEAVDEKTGEAVAHGYSKRQVLCEIDYFMDKNISE